MRRLALYTSFFVAMSVAPHALAQRSFPRIEPGRTLFVGHSLIRFTSTPDQRGHSRVLADVPATLESLRQLAVRAHQLARTSEHPVRVIASNGWGMEGYWDTEGADHEFRRSALGIIRSPGLERDAIGVGGDFESHALRGRWSPIPGGASAKWDTIVSITMASYSGPDVYTASTRSMNAFYDMMRTGVDTRASNRAALGANPDLRLVHYMGVPPSDRVESEMCQLAALYARYERRYPRSVTVPMPLAFVAAAHEFAEAGLSRSRDAALRELRFAADDQVHYSLRGVYLAAAVFYAMFYGDPRGLGPIPRSGLNRRETELLAEAAVEAYARWDEYTHDPTTLGCR